MIQFGDGSYIEYTYTSDGTKLRTRYGVQPGIGPLTPSGMGNTVSDGSGTAGPESQASLPSQDELSRIDYCGNVVYDRGERRLILGNGYVTFDAATEAPSYHFYLRDHLGNNRVVVARDGTVEQVTHYYPFGGLMRESTNPAVQPYKYGGKELDRTSGLDAYDFGARTYFADRLQWGQVDPMCEKYYEWSPYAYCSGNPVNYIDEHGDSIIFIGSPEDVNYAVSAFNKYLGINYVQTNDKGTLSQNMNASMVGYVLMNEGQNQLFSMLRESISSKGMTTIGLVNNSEDVLIGSASLKQIDVGDIQEITKQTQDKLPFNSTGTLSHEVYEQYLIQQKGIINESAHVKASNKESKIVQSVLPADRRNVDYDSGKMLVEAYTPHNSILTHTINVSFSRNKITVISYKKY